MHRDAAVHLPNPNGQFNYTGHPYTDATVKVILEWGIGEVLARARIEIRRGESITQYEIYAKDKNTLKHNIEAIMAGPVVWEDI
jgi:hypothetical protein